MQITNVRVPAALLLDRHLTATAKLLWLLLHLGPGTGLASGTGGASRKQTPGILEARSGLTRHTVLRGLSQLNAAGWLVASIGSSSETASIPPDLLLDRQVGVQDKLLYAALQLTPGFRKLTGQFTYHSLCAMTGVSHNTLKQAVTTLKRTGWLQAARKNHRHPIRFKLRNPAAARRQDAVFLLSLRLEEAEFKGEALMREYLSLIVDSDEYDDNASPGFLVNPYTGEEMQFDRYYPPHVAFEFNGAQHDRPTERYSSEAKVLKQRGRDLMKMGICVDRGIKLVVLRPRDLTLETLRTTVDGLLPLRSLAGYEPVIAYLEKVSRAYRRQARKGEQGTKAGRSR